MSTPTSNRKVKTPCEVFGDELDAFAEASGSKFMIIRGMEGGMEDGMEDECENVDESELRTEQMEYLRYVMITKECGDFWELYRKKVIVDFQVSPVATLAVGRLSQSVPMMHNRSTILTAAVNNNDARVRNPYAPPSGHNCNNSSLPGTLPCQEGHANLAMFALSRPNQALLALHLANMRNQFISMTLNSYSHDVLFSNNATKSGLATNERALFSHQAIASLHGKGGVANTTSSTPVVPTLVPLRSKMSYGNIRGGFSLVPLRSKISYGNIRGGFSSHAVREVVTDTNEEALATLGSTCLERRKNKTPYFDAAALQDPDSVMVANRRTRGGVTEPFPGKLYRMIMEAKEAGKEELISFFPHGRGFGMYVKLVL